MTAIEAKKLSKKNAIKIAKQNRIEQCKQKKEETKKFKENRKAFYDKWISKINLKIDFAVADGHNRVEVDMEEDIRLTNGIYLQGEEYKETLNKIKKELEKNGFSVDIGNHGRMVDTTAAYMNSGGECGRSEPYWTKIFSIIVSWK